MNPAKRHSGPTTLHDLELRIVELEINQKHHHESEMSEIRTLAEQIKALRGDLSAHGAPPKPTGKGKGKADDSDEGKKPGTWGIREGTAREVAIIGGVLIGVLSSVIGMVQSFRNGSNASDAAYDGAQQAIERAVEQAEAVPVATPPVVVPVPRVVPVPVPVPAPAAAPDPASDLLPQVTE